MDCKILLLSNSNREVKSLWVKIKDWINKGCLVDRVYLMRRVC